MDPVEVLQTVLSVMQAGAPATTPSNATSNPSSPSLSATAAPISIPQMIMTIFSMAAFWDWVKLLLVGALLEACRRGSATAWEKLVDCVWATAEFEWDDDSAEWLIYWMSQRKVFQKARSIEVRNWYFGHEGVRVNDIGDGDDRDDQVVFLPSLSRTYSLWYRGRYMTVSRDRIREGGPRRDPDDMLKISILTRDSGLLRELLLEARKAYKAANGHLISVFVTDGRDDWMRVATQEKRPTSSVVLDPGVLDLVLEDAKDFLNSRKWYADRGIPFRRGYLLYGAPGSGKTSMIHSIAGELGLDIYILSLTVGSLNDNSLKAFISQLPRSCILLMEDIDVAFTRGMARRGVTHATPPGTDEDEGEGSGERDDGSGGFNSVTLSGLLNALDGIAAQEGRILFATTNDYPALDPALLRPGRLDLHVEFGLASEHQARELFKRFYTASESQDVLPEDGDGDKDKDEDEDEEKDSGYASRTASTIHDYQDSTAINESTPLMMPEAVKSVYVGMTHTGHGSHLPPKKVVVLADRFASAIPPHTFSMATLQGYLMAYKVRPYVAVEEAPAWVEKKMREAAAQAGAKKVASSSSVSILENIEGL